MDEVQIHRTPNELGFAMLDAIAVGDLKEGEIPSELYFAEGLCGRRSIGAANHVVVTQKHKKQHLTIALRGHCFVADESGERKEIHAPGVWVTEAGTQRSIYCVTEVEWITVHANPENLRDESELEKAYCENPFPEYRVIAADKADYKAVLMESGISEEFARAASEFLPDQITDAQDGVYVGPSPREGMGVFADKEFVDGDLIGAIRKGYMRTQMGRYMNHSAMPNARFILSGDGIDVIATMPIFQGEEITVDYRNARDVSMEANLGLEIPL